ncbi:lactonase family protein [Deinococcus oregonensis]|uniref:Lactonase family protein n=1 Tax=Deinococcus oregonensis TaxID=1805970 RepID=A0ABV6AU31_9DEIO
MTAFHLLVGTYTQPEPHAPNAHSQGIQLLTFNAGELSLRGVAAELTNPSFIAVHPQGQAVYAVSEVSQGTLHVYRVRPGNQTLEPGEVYSTQGAAPAHVSLDAAGTRLFTVNYVSGASILAYRVLPATGELLPGPATARHQGQSVHAGRQESPHAHCARASWDGRHLYVTDLGTDEVVTYPAEWQAPALTRLNTLRLPAGCGPRHLSFHPDGQFGFISLELSSELAVVSRDPASGQLTLLQRLSTLVDGPANGNLPAEVLVSPCASFICVSNRGRNTVALLTWDSEAAQARLVAEVPTLGQTPRSMAFTPCGTFLLVANQDSATITVFSWDSSRGHLEPLRTVPCPTPTSLCFLPA